MSKQLFCVEFLLGQIFTIFGFFTCLIQKASTTSYRTFCHGDVFLMTKADLEEYNSACDDEAIGKELQIAPKIKARRKTATVSCLIACLKVSGVCVPVAGQMLLARAC